jgi:hypothetical protein
MREIREHPALVSDAEEPVKKKFRVASVIAIRGEQRIFFVEELCAVFPGSEL